MPTTPAPRKPAARLNRYVSLIERQKDGSALALIATADAAVVERVTELLVEHARAVGDMEASRAGAK